VVSLLFPFDIRLTIFIGQRLGRLPLSWPIFSSLEYHATFASSRGCLLRRSLYRRRRIFAIPPAGYPVLNVSDENNFIFVYPNYRVNAFGFLPGKEIASSPTSDLNPGLLDQQASLIWTNKYIEAFGGDPKNVSIWGQSAGAGSVVAQVIANAGNTNPPLFSKT
jgi:hypothetical protein